MKAIILAGGLGTRLSEETTLRPKPMVELGGKPILWHIMKTYSHYGVNEFIVCLGYKGYMVKEYFANYFLHCSDVTFDLSKNTMTVHKADPEPWKVTLVDTGEGTMTGGRLLRVRKYLGDETFCFTYGDGVADVNITSLIDAHRHSGALATVTAVRPPGRFGTLHCQGDRVERFDEKPSGTGSWINAGYFVLEPAVLDRISGDETAWERQPLESLAGDGQLHAYYHDGFWQPMDTMRDKEKLEGLWRSGTAPWKVW